jgi:hypothetical protein
MWVTDASLQLGDSYVNHHEFTSYSLLSRRREALDFTPHGVAGRFSWYEFPYISYGRAEKIFLARRPE